MSARWRFPIVGFDPGAPGRSADGDFYGATTYGGSADAGTLYRVSPSGEYTVLHSFSNDGTDGKNPYGPPIQAPDGNFYGVTFGGGDDGCGVVYKLTPAGSLTRFRSLQLLEACSPTARLTLGSDGHLYGTARGGGIHVHGSVFRISLAGSWKTLHSFDANVEGFDPYAPVVEASNGRFYGTTTNGGAYSAGTVFSVTRSGTFKTLHTFVQDGVDGMVPYGGLVQTADGYLHGTTYVGGYYNSGTVYRMSLSAALRIEHDFGALADDGFLPMAGLALASDGRLYGTTRQGGQNNAGVIYRMTPKLP